MFRERKEKIAGELDKAKKAEENAAALENQVNRDNELARQQEKQLLVILWMSLTLQIKLNL